MPIKPITTLQITQLRLQDVRSHVRHTWLISRGMEDLLSAICRTPRTEPAHRKMQMRVKALRARGLVTEPQPQCEPDGTPRSDVPPLIHCTPAGAQLLRRLDEYDRSAAAVPWGGASPTIDEED